MASHPVAVPAPKTLLDAYNNICSGLIPQMQGTCGVFAFHYAALLLQKLDEDRRIPGVERPPVDPPKKRYGDAVTEDGSIRKRAKVLVHSAQGETLTVDEMTTLVNSYTGYHAEPFTCGIARAFITKHLASGHPVLIAYWMRGGFGPWTLAQEKKTPTKPEESGSHWSVIVGEQGGNYQVINPHNPVHLQNYDQATLLISNSDVDEKLYARYWEKTKSTTEMDPYAVGRYKTSIEEAKPPKGLWGLLFGRRPDYDIGRHRRVQRLKNVMVAVR